ncbi:recombinase zinc beta ribbon domain-containing protein [Patescibacteria group bacterium]|nr:recombinase zinc beta ribbon domain-containing protein [Patescibacteria group bacterium]MBU4264981.1 recombinase zinc beta ribbon domain-containing protein [Patescibacteria group bacterium]MBU4389818.1 recombinase zinc beta ribbon domain-containing protein [Patescibacteria group bacterium]MBU4397436.1 recombinase zinc beta ribbon domain-containing protein [Patescibacteria group bacterium]MBU4430935.1 recombinase zinc beta ribbon domain-containing protein [Patescibacteria group bacterium]
MLSNKFYIGILTYKGELHKGNHQCFINKKLFDRVQKVLERKSRARTQGLHFAFFTGLATCGECGAGITAEQHIKYYKGTNRVAKYVYYRCTKKKGVCSQKYLSQTNLVSQLRQTIKSCSLHPNWKPYINTWIKEKMDEEKSKVKAKLKTATNRLSAIDQKLSKLLDLFLEDNLDKSIYQTKQNNLFEQKQKLEEKIKQIQHKGSSWLEPLKEFLRCTILAHKIAHKKSALNELRPILKNIGSNFTLLDKRLFLNLNFAYATLATNGRAACAPKTENDFSLLVTPRGIEPRLPG